MPKRDRPHPSSLGALPPVTINPTPPEGSMTKRQGSSGRECTSVNDFSADGQEIQMLLLRTSNAVLYFHESFTLSDVMSCHVMSYVSASLTPKSMTSIAVNEFPFFA